MKKNKAILLLILVLILTLSTNNIVLAVQDYNSSRSNRPRPITDGDKDEDEDSVPIGEFALQLRLRIGDQVTRAGEKELTLDAAPFIENDRTMVPLRFIGEQLGAEINWDEAERKVGYNLGDKIVELWIDKNIALVNGIEMLVDENPKVVPKIKNNRTFVPVRFIVEALGFEIEWNAVTKEVMVQDYNSSRSNRPRPIKTNDTNDDDENSEDAEPGKQEVQDYNSSRSNKPTPIKPNDPDEEGESEDAGISEAQDYNSSRSNRPKPISDLNLGDEDKDKLTGLNIIWDSINKRAIYNLKGIRLEIWIDKDIILINEKQIKVNEKIPTVISNKDNEFDLGQIHFLSKVAGYTLEWNPKTKQLTIIKV